MNEERQQALTRLAALGFQGADVYLAELIPAVEMAWADGEIQPRERLVLEAYCEALVDRLNREAGYAFFTLRRAHRLLGALLTSRLSPAARQAALEALSRADGVADRERMLTWAEAVGGAAGAPPWDTREQFWLQAMRRAFAS